jgi:hypothetical protein
MQFAVYACVDPLYARGTLPLFHYSIHFFGTPVEHPDLSFKKALPNHPAWFSDTAKRNEFLI